MAEEDIIKGQEKMSKGQDKMSDILLKMKGIDEKRLVKIEQQNELFKERQATLDEQKAQLESLGLTATENKEFSQAQNKLTQQKTKFEAQQTQEINRKTFGEKVKDRAESFKNFEGLKDSIGNLGKGLGKGIGGFFKNLGGKGLTGLKTALGTAAIAGFLIATIAFLNSKYWTKTKDFIVNKMVPAVQKIFEVFRDFILPPFMRFFNVWKENIGPLFNNAIETITLGFTALKEIFTGLFSGDGSTFLSGVKKLFIDFPIKLTAYIGEGLFASLEAALALFGIESQMVTDIKEGFRKLPETISAAFTAIGEFFTVYIPEKTTEIKDSVTKFFGDNVVAPFKNMLTNIGNFFTETIPETFDNIVGSVNDFFIDIGNKIKGVFTDVMSIIPTWDDISAKIGEGMDFVSDFVDAFLGLIPTFEDIKALLPNPKEILEKAASDIGDFLTFGDNDKRKAGAENKKGKGVGGKKEGLDESVTTLTTSQKNAFSNSFEPNATLKTSTNPNNMSGALDAMLRSQQESAESKSSTNQVIINNSDNSMKSETTNTHQETIVDRNLALQAAGVYF